MELHARLQARRPEIERDVLSRVYGVSDPTGVSNSEYVDGLRAAVSAALDFGLAAIERGERRAPPIPAALLAQARVAARSGVGLDTVLRRYYAGHSLLDNFLVEEVEEGDPLQHTVLKRLLGAQAALFDRLIAAVSKEHTSEAKTRLDSTEQRRTERVQRLLDGELIETTGFDYDFEGSHLGMIAVGPEAKDAVHDLAKARDRRLLLLRRDEEIVWAWLGGRRKTDPADVARLVSLAGWPAQVSLAIGEPAQGLAGWRLTHNQASAVLPFVPRSQGNIVLRYADDPVVFSAAHDELLTTSLHEIFLAPLEQERDGGETHRETLRAYFAAKGNISSAAAALDVARPTVTSRLRKIENRLGHSIDAARTAIEVALRLQDLGVIPVTRGEPPYGR